MGALGKEGIGTYLRLGSSFVTGGMSSFGTKQTWHQGQSDGGDKTSRQVMGTSSPPIVL